MKFCLKIKKKKYKIFVSFCFFFFNPGNRIIKNCTNSNASILVEQMTTKKLMILKELGKLTL